MAEFWNPTGCCGGPGFQALLLSVMTMRDTAWTGSWTGHSVTHLETSALWPAVIRPQ